MPNTYKPLLEKIKHLNDVQAKYEKASLARFDCPHGSSRAKVTTLNARLGIYAEAKGALLIEIVEELKKVGIIL